MHRTVLAVLALAVVGLAAGPARAATRPPAGEELPGPLIPAPDTAPPEGAGGSAPAAGAASLPEAPGEAEPLVPGNPAATTVLVGTGDLGRFLGVDRHGLRLGGVSVMGVSVDML